MTESSEAWILRKAEKLRGLTVLQTAAYLTDAYRQFKVECAEPCPPDLGQRLLVAAYSDQLKPK